jgi:flagellar basal-body rod modification protein FlgD
MAMDINSMMSAVQAHSAKRVANGMAASRGNGLSTAASATTGAGKLALSRNAGTPVSGAATAAANTTSTASSANAITSNDFLTLLVTEMKNQDPTQPTDPNAYIQQLVGVNSLQQLISINSELAPTATGGGTAGSLAANGIMPAAGATPSA